MTDEIFRKIDSHDWTAAVFGLGYVGLPLVVTMARAGIDAWGFDVNPAVTAALSEGHSHIDDVSDDDLKAVAARTTFTSDVSAVAACDVLFICVPTPLSMGKQPDVSYVQAAARTIAGILRPGHVVILESTTYPGTTEDLLRGIFDETGLKLDEDYLLAYSPERVDPANASFGTSNIPRVVGGASQR
ncbi:MAG TPA: NAD(P)-binding domain-containing protein, partial [Actinomycetota bacterium]|nr:NAD(P)-binding domain-containing protein [Actinomycetota bacterium]